MRMPGPKSGMSLDLEVAWQGVVQILALSDQQGLTTTPLQGPICTHAHTHIHTYTSNPSTVDA
jgi:hypothetical protein